MEKISYFQHFVSHESDVSTVFLQGNSEYWSKRGSELDKSVQYRQISEKNLLSTF